MCFNGLADNTPNTVLASQWMNIEMANAANPGVIEVRINIKAAKPNECPRLFCSK